MNTTELLDQFVVEARECLEAIGQRLLQVEKNPSDAALLNDLFRSVHTLKGNCGLFEFKPLETVVHAAEDLLDRVRSRTLAYSDALADALLDAMDFAGRLIDEVERTGRIDPAEALRAAPFAAALRVLLDGSTTASPPPVDAAPTPTDTPSPTHAEPQADAGDLALARSRPVWLTRLDDLPAVGIALRYVPEPECFFKGEDPWRLATTTPGLVRLHLATQAPWPATGDAAAFDAWDCYRCNLDLVLLSDAPLAEVDAHFRCVPEQVERLDLATLAPAATAAIAATRAVAPASAPAPAPATPEASTDRAAAVSPEGEPLVRHRIAALWSDQIALLSRPGIADGTVLAAARSLRGLLAVQANDDSPGLPAAPSAAAWLAWAQQHRPDRPAPAATTAPGAALAAPDAGVSSHPAADDASSPDRPQRVLKVSQEKIDRLMDLIGEMVVAKNSLPYLAQRAEDVFGQRELAREIKAQYAVINRIADDLQRAVMEVRMLPVGTVFQRFGRLVRDISKKLGKDVRMVIEGEETEADKNVIEPLADPLIHILRNSLDHGIELPEVRIRAAKPAQGTIRIVARQESDRVVLEISDDGAGVDADRVRAKAVERGLIPADRAGTLGDHEAVQLIFLPGFSTADSISDLSGRGVGMDVVRTAVERINGTVELSSRAGHGTTIRLSLPLSMAVTHVMVVESAGRRFGVPMDLIVETVRVPAEDVHRFKSAATTVLRGRIVPLQALNALLGLDAPPQQNAEGELAVLVVRLASGSVGLLVDQFHGASDIILKPLEGVLAGLTGFAGTALMGDGSVLMVLNPKELV